MCRVREKAEGVGAKLRAELDALSEEARRAKEQRIRGIVQRMLCKSKGAALNRWIEVIGERKRHRFLVNKALQRLKNRIASAALNTWVDMVAERKENRRKQRKAAMMFQKKAMVAAWNTWSEVVEHSRREKLNMNKAVVKWKKRILRGAMASWIVSRLRSHFALARVHSKASQLMQNLLVRCHSSPTGVYRQQAPL